jgi:hypothetical protein
VYDSVLLVAVVACGQQARVQTPYPSLGVSGKPHTASTIPTMATPSSHSPMSPYAPPCPPPRLPPGGQTCRLPAGTGRISVVRVTVLGQMGLALPPALSYLPPSAAELLPPVWTTDVPGTVEVVGAGFGVSSVTAAVWVVPRLNPVAPGAALYWCAAGVPEPPELGEFHCAGASIVGVVWCVLPARGRVLARFVAMWQSCPTIRCAVRNTCSGNAVYPPHGLGCMYCLLFKASSLHIAARLHHRGGCAGARQPLAGWRRGSAGRRPAVVRPAAADSGVPHGAAAAIHQRTGQFGGWAGLGMGWVLGLWCT